VIAESSHKIEVFHYVSDDETMIETLMVRGSESYRLRIEERDYGYVFHEYVNGVLVRSAVIYHE